MTDTLTDMTPEEVYDMYQRAFRDKNDPTPADNPRVIVVCDAASNAVAMEMVAKNLPGIIVVHTEMSAEDADAEIEVLKRAREMDDILIIEDGRRQMMKDIAQRMQELYAPDESMQAPEEDEDNRPWARGKMDKKWLRQENRRQMMKGRR